MYQYWHAVVQSQRKQSYVKLLLVFRFTVEMGFVDVFHKLPTAIYIYATLRLKSQDRSTLCLLSMPFLSPQVFPTHDTVSLDISTAWLLFTEPQPFYFPCWSLIRIDTNHHIGNICICKTRNAYITKLVNR